MMKAIEISVNCKGSEMNLKFVRCLQLKFQLVSKQWLGKSAEESKLGWLMCLNSRQFTPIKGHPKNRHNSHVCLFFKLLIPIDTQDSRQVWADYTQIFLAKVSKRLLHSILMTIYYNSSNTVVMACFVHSKWKMREICKLFFYDMTVV